MSSSEKKEQPISRRKYLASVGGLAAAAVVGWGVAGYVASNPLAQVVEKTMTVTETQSVAQTPTVVPTKKYKWGLVPYYIDDDWYRVDVQGAQYYAEDRGYDFVVVNPHGSISDDIKYIHDMVTGLKVDGLTVTPADLVVIIDTLEWAHGEGVPLIATEYDVDTAAVDYSIEADYVSIGRSLGQKMVEAAQKDGVETKGNVFIVGGPSEDYQMKTMVQGEMEFLKDYPDLKPIEFHCPGWATDVALKTVVDAYHGYGRPFGILDNNMTTAIGAVEGLKTANIAVPRGQKDHVYVCTFDGARAIWDYMDAGLVDCLSDMPNPHMDCIPQDFLAILKEKGPEGLPPEGTTVISDLTKPEGPQPDGTWNFVLHGKEHKGVNPYTFAPWVPATVTMYHGHRRLNVASSIITPDMLPEYKKVSWVNLASAWLS